MSSHTTPAHIIPPRIPSHMQAIIHQSHPPPNVTSCDKKEDLCLLYCITANSGNYITTSTTSSKYNAPSFRAISLRSILYSRTALSHRTTTLNARPCPHIFSPHTCQTFTFASRNRIAIPSHFKTEFPSKHAMPTSRHCCHNLYLAQHDKLQLHIVGRHMMQVNTVHVPNICNTAPHERCPKSELLHVLVRFFPDTPSSVQLLLLSTHIVQNNMSSHTTPAHISPSIPSHMQPGIHQSHPPPNVTSIYIGYDSMKKFATPCCGVVVHPRSRPSVNADLQSSKCTETALCDVKIDIGSL